MYCMRTSKLAAIFCVNKDDSCLIDKEKGRGEGKKRGKYIYICFETYNINRIELLTIKQSKGYVPAFPGFPRTSPAMKQISEILHLEIWGTVLVTLHFRWMLRYLTAPRGVLCFRYLR